MCPRANASIHSRRTRSLYSHHHHRQQQQQHTRCRCSPASLFSLCMHTALRQWLEHNDWVYFQLHIARSGSTDSLAHHCLRTVSRAPPPPHFLSVLPTRLPLSSIRVSAPLARSQRDGAVERIMTCTTSRSCC